MKERINPMSGNLGKLYELISSNPDGIISSMKQNLMNKISLDPEDTLYSFPESHFKSDLLETNVYCDKKFLEKSIENYEEHFLRKYYSEKLNCPELFYDSMQVYLDNPPDPTSISKEEIKPTDIVFNSGKLYNDAVTGTVSNLKLLEDKLFGSKNAVNRISDKAYDFNYGLDRLTEVVDSSVSTIKNIGNYVNNNPVLTIKILNEAAERYSLEFEKQSLFLENMKLTETRRREGGLFPKESLREREIINRLRDLEPYQEKLPEIDYFDERFNITYALNNFIETLKVEQEKLLIEHPELEKQRFVFPEISDYSKELILEFRGLELPVIDHEKELEKELSPKAEEIEPGW